jgi:hypothetical protein
VWLSAGDAPIVELDRLEAEAWREFVCRIRVIAAED